VRPFGGGFDEVTRARLWDDLPLVRPLHRRALRKLEGVASVDVRLQEGEIVVGYDPTVVFLADLLSTMKQEGYGGEASCPETAPVTIALRCVRSMIDDTV
jgi:hypothetical protein